MGSNGHRLGRICHPIAADQALTIHWLICLADDHPAAKAGRPPGFLSEAERIAFARLRFPKRRREWLLGRWTRDELLAVLEHLYRKSADRIWRSLTELTRNALAPTTERLL